MFLISPKVAYNFSELIEMHAVDTYGEFVDENEELLKKLPPSPVAVRYYENEDLYLYEYENCLCLFSAIYLVNY
jgi:ubiquinol oxidase